MDIFNQETSQLIYPGTCELSHHGGSDRANNLGVTIIPSSNSFGPGAGGGCPLAKTAQVQGQDQRMQGTMCPFK